jgi:hypothetical protein
MDTAHKISSWQELSKRDKMIFLVYYFLICIFPIISIFAFLDLSPLSRFSEELSGFIGVGIFLLFPIITFSLLQERIQLILRYPLRFFSPFLIQAGFLIFNFFRHREDAIQSIIIFALSEFCGLFLILSSIIIFFIYKKRIAREERIGDKLVKLCFGLFITLFLWIPLVALCYAYLVNSLKFSPLFAFIAIIQFFTGVITVALSQKKLLKDGDT